MADNIYREVFDDKEILESLQRVENHVADLEKQSQDAGKSMSQAFNDAGDAAKSMSDKIGLSADAVNEQAKAVSNAEKVNKSWLGSIKETILGTQIGGKSLGEWGTQAKEYANKIKGATAATEGMNAVSRVLSTVLKATGIGLLVGLVASAIKYFTSFQSGIDKVNRVLSVVGPIVNVLVERFLAFGSAIFSAAKAVYSLITLDFDGFLSNGKEAVGSLTDAVSGLGSELKEAAEWAVILETASQRLRDTTLKQAVAAAELNIELQKFKQISDDETKSIAQRIAARQRAGEIEKRLAEEAVDRAADARFIAQGRLHLEQDNAEAIENNAKAQIEFSQAIQEKQKVEFELEKDLRDLRNKAGEEAKKRRDEEEKFLEKLTKDIEKLRVEATPEGIEKDIAAIEKRYNDLIKITIDGRAKLEEISKKRPLTDNEQEKFIELETLQLKLKLRQAEAVQTALKGFVDEQFQEVEKNFEEQEKLRKQQLDATKKDLNEQKAIRETEIDQLSASFDNFIAVLKSGGVAEKDIAEKRLEFDKRIKQERIQSEIDFNEALLGITDENDKNAIEQIKANILKLQTQLQGLDIAPPKGKGKSLFDLLGIDPNDPGVKEAIGQIVDSLHSLTDARIQEAEAATKAAADKVKAAEDALKQEQDIAERGLANNVDARKRDLANAKAAQDKALSEQRKAQKAQILLDSALQASNLATAATKIFSSYASLPVVGQVLAISAIALMIGAFVKSRAQALAAINAPKLRKGRKITGRTHEQGGELFELEHNEQVVGAGESRGQDAFFDNMRKGKYKGVDLAQIMDLHGRGGHAVSDTKQRVDFLAVQRVKAEASVRKSDSDRIFREVGREIVQAIESKEVVYPWKEGYKVMKKSGSKTLIQTVQPEGV